MPAVFVDTMDMWLEGKRARLAVTWAGPYSGLVIGGLVSIFLVLRPDFGLNAVLYQFTLITYLTVFLNLNPLLEWDGYYLLMDWLEIPMLRQRSLDFVRTGLWQKLRGIREAGQSVRSVLGSLSREQRIFSVFGLLSAAWTAYALFMAARFWQSQLIHALSGLWAEGGNIGKIILAAALIAISLQFMLSIALYVLGMVRKALVWAGRRGLFDNTWQVAGMLLAVAVALTVAPSYVRHPAVRPALNLAVLAIGAYYAWRGAAAYAGSRFAPVFRLLGLFLVGLFLSEAGAQAVYWDVLSSDVASPFVVATRHLAYACALLAGLMLLAGTNLKDLRAVEKALLALGLLAGCALVVWIVTVEPTTLSSAGALLDLTGSLFPLLALTLLVPTLLSFWRTAFGPAWLALSVALGGLVSVVLQGWYPLFSYLLLAASFLLQHLARTQVTFVSGQPEAALDLSDPRRLRRAFAWTVASVFGQFREVGGERHARILAERFNNFALAAGWRVSIVTDQVDDSIPADVNLIERGETYAAALTLLLDLIAQEVGEKLTVQALQRAYDALPWEEREIGAQYLFPDIDRAETLSREFQATRQDYRGLLQRMPIFATMEDEEINLLVSRLAVEQASPGQVVIRQGDKGDKFYIIAQGHVEVSVRDERGVSEVVNQLDRGDYFGELALLHDAPRSATCRATVPTKVLSLSREDFMRLVKARFALREKVDRSIKWADLLRRMPLFAEVDAQQIQLIAAQLREEAYEPGAVIIRQGEIGETFYVIESGRVQVSVAQDGEEKVIAERGPGEYVGEIALLLEVPRTATVRALTPTNVLTLHKSDFDRLVVKHLYVSRGLERETSRRMIDLRRVAEAD
jgi:CRP-like cAMP-binding protein